MAPLYFCRPNFRASNCQVLNYLLSKSLFAPKTNHEKEARLHSNMVDNQKKRKLPAAPANASAKKRRTASATKKAGPKSVAKPKRVLEAGSLKWKTVDIPEMFNDAEGFYGLEEVTGVEVVRSGNLVKFVCRLMTSLHYLGVSNQHYIGNRR